MKNNRSLKFILILATVAVALIVFNIASTIAVGQYNCHQINHLNSYNLAAIKRAEKTLPTIAYYKKHPAELAVQQKYLHEQESNFSPIACASIFNPFPK